MDQSIAFVGDSLAVAQDGLDPQHRRVILAEAVLRQPFNLAAHHLCAGQAQVLVHHRNRLARKRLVRATQCQVMETVANRDLAQRRKEARYRI